MLKNCNLSFSSLLAKRTAESGHKTAFIYKEKEYSWCDIDSASSVIAEKLAHEGVKKGTHVGLCGKNSINWIFTFFAIQKLGGIAVFINPGMNPTEVENICQIGNVTHLCYAETEGLPSFDIYRDICLAGGQVKSMFNFDDDVDFSSKLQEKSNSDQRFFDILKPDDACLIIFTSGSTGKPKAVLSSAYSMLTSMEQIIENTEFSESDVNLAFLPFFHVFGFVSALIAPLVQNFVSVIPETKNPGEMISLIEKHQITVFNTVPTMMLAVVANRDFLPEKLSSLRLTILGGSATTEEQIKILQKLLPHNHFCIIYGMSENAAISLTDYRDTPEHIAKTVGKPVRGMVVKIKDSQGNLLSDGTEGEICVKSESMLVCYYRLPIGMQPIDTDGFLRTGDLGYIDSEGYIRLTGRIKDLIICGGENISPGDVSDAILSLGYFSDVRVVGIPDYIKGEVVAAAVILKPDCVWDEEKVKKELSAKLAQYKCPCYYKVFSAFPLLDSGKTDKLSIIRQIKEEVD